MFQNLLTILLKFLRNLLTIYSKKFTKICPKFTNLLGYKFSKNFFDHFPYSLNSRAQSGLKYTNKPLELTNFSVKSLQSVFFFFLFFIKNFFKFARFFFLPNYYSIRFNQGPDSLRRMSRRNNDWSKFSLT